MVGNNLKSHLEHLEKQMRDAAADLDFETAARLRDEIKRLQAKELEFGGLPGGDSGSGGKKAKGGGNVVDAADPMAMAAELEEEAISPVTGRSKYGRKTKRDRQPAGGERFGPRGEPLKPRGEGSDRRPAPLARPPKPGDAAASPTGHDADAPTDGASGQPGGDTTAGSYFQKPSLDDMGPGTDTARPDRPGLFRKNSLDEMTVGRTEKPVGKPAPKKPAPCKPADTASSGTGTVPSTSTNAPHGEPVEPRTPVDDAAPIRRERIGRGSYEDPADQKRKRRPGKTGRPGR